MMKCYCCPGLATSGYEYPEEYCAAGVQDDSPEATTWKDGEPGCTLRYQTVKKRLRENIDGFAESWKGFAEFCAEQEYNEKHGVNVSDPNGKYVLQALHAIGLDYEKPYTRHGKKFYKPYRNGFDAGGSDVEVWDALVEIGYAYKVRTYHLTNIGLWWLGGVLGITIKEETK